MKQSLDDHWGACLGKDSSMDHVCLGMWKSGQDVDDARGPLAYLIHG